MRTTGELYEHRGLIAFTGAFLAAIALAGCGNEKLTTPQAQYNHLPNSQTEIAFQKKQTLTIGEPSVPPTLRQTLYPDTVDFVRTIPFITNKSTSEPLQPRPIVEPSVTTLPVLPEITSEIPSTQCWLNDVSGPLHEVVTALEKQSLLYATQPLTDCSGIFHRVVQGLKHKCPAKEFPTVENDRDSRAIARWYHEQGKLQLIENAVDNTELLQPGVVLFFGKNDSHYSDFSVEELLNPRKGIAHLGVVVNVHKNASGQVVHYELFHGHGRKGKTPASITDWHKRTPTRSGYPPFGNGRQQWVAMARL
jgi:hypothetical protein